MTWELTVSLFLVAAFFFFWNFLSQFIDALCVRIDCCSCGFNQQHTLIWMQVVYVLRHTVHTVLAQKGATKGRRRKHWNQDNGHNSFWSCRKIEKTLYFLIRLSVHGHNSHFYSDYTFMKNWFSIPSNLKRYTLFVRISHYVPSKWEFHSNLWYFYNF